MSDSDEQMARINAMIQARADDVAIRNRAVAIFAAARDGAIPGWTGHPPDEKTDPEGFLSWRHNYQMPVMAHHFPKAAKQLPECTLCGKDAAGHVS